MTAENHRLLRELLLRLRGSTVEERRRQADALERLAASIPPETLLTNLLLALGDDAATSYRRGVLDSLKAWMRR